MSGIEKRRADFERELELEREQSKSVNAYGLASVLRAVAGGLLFVGVAGLTITSDNFGALLVLSGLAVACLVGAWAITKDLE